MTVAEIAGLLSWSTYSLTALIGFSAAAAFAPAAMGVLIILNMISIERPFFFIHKPKEARPFRLQKSLENDARSVFRKSLKL